MTRVHLVVHGRVQGVYFRQSSQEEAQRLGLRGWVRNRRDGTVEAVAEGPQERVDAFVAWCHRGPPMASVTRVESAREEPASLPEGFHVRPTL